MKREWAREKYTICCTRKEKWAGLVLDWYLEAERDEKRSEKG
jgi:hypothetical protein